MEQKKSDRSKYNICWISILVIFIGAIVYPIVFESAKQALLKPRAVVIRITPHPTVQESIQAPPIIVTPVDTLPQVSITTPKISLLFERDLGIGDKGPDVKMLQEFLNKRGFIVSESGNGSLGQENETFGPGTQKALKAFQEAYADILLTPLGLSQGTGFFGQNTRDFVNS